MATPKASTASNGTTNPVARTAGDVATIEENIERLRDDIAGLAQSITRYGADKTGEYKNRANQAGKDLAKVSQQTLDSLSEELAGLEKALSTRVREKPLQTLGIAAGVGFLVAFFLARR